MMRPYIGSWKRLAVHGVAAMLFGLTALVWPGITLYALVMLWGAFALIDGITALSAAFADRLLIHRGWVALWGVIGIGAGIITFLWPAMTGLALLVVIATWSLLIGSSWIAYAFKARKQVSRPWSIGLGGGLLVLLGVLLVLNPGAGAISIVWAIGWFVMMFGAVELWMARGVRRETDELAGQTRINTSHLGHALR